MNCTHPISNHSLCGVPEKHVFCLNLCTDVAIRILPYILVWCTRLFLLPVPLSHFPMHPAIAHGPCGFWTCLLRRMFFLWVSLLNLEIFYHSLVLRALVPLSLRTQLWSNWLKWLQCPMSSAGSHSQILSSLASRGVWGSCGNFREGTASEVSQWRETLMVIHSLATSASSRHETQWLLALDTLVAMAFPHDGLSPLQSFLPEVASVRNFVPDEELFWVFAAVGIYYSNRGGKVSPHWSPGPRAMSTVNGHYLFMDDTRKGEEGEGDKRQDLRYAQDLILLCCQDPEGCIWASARHIF